MFIMVIILYHLEKLSVWIDNIHCYASQSNIQDTSKDSISPSIIMICTGEDTIDDQVGQ